MAGDRDWLAAGEVGRPHGLDGSFHVRFARAALLALGATVRTGDRDAEIVRRAGTDDRPILRLAGIDDREAADALRGTVLLVPRSVAPALEEDEWWAEDLEGCRVVDGDREVGTVARLLPLPSCEALEVARGEQTFLIPLVRDAVRRVDVAARVIDVDLAFLGDTAPASLDAEADAGAGAKAAAGRGPAAPSASTTTAAAPEAR